jgi:uncharacterized membrane protein
MLNHIRLHPRLFIALGIGVVVLLLLPAGWGWLARIIVAWNLACTLYLGLAFHLMSRQTTDEMRSCAELQDENGWTLLGVSSAAAAVKDLPEHDQLLLLGVVIYTIVVSWFFLHTLFTLHYAHEYYGPTDPDDQLGLKERGGLLFPGDAAAPTYIDFAYYSFTIGMTAQTSDTACTSAAMRGLTLAQAILTFFFNTVILALSINIAASLL